jgi:hypothetical protein
MATDQIVDTGLHVRNVNTRLRVHNVNTRLHVRKGPWSRPLVVSVSVTAVLAFLAWIAGLALTLPTRYLANHWNAAWVGFDVMLLISLLAGGWAVASRRPWAGTALMVSAAMLTCDAWFDVTTASGTTATLVSLGFAAGVELPLAAGLAWVATRRARLVRTGTSQGTQRPYSLERNGSP